MSSSSNLLFFSSPLQFIYPSSLFSYTLLFNSSSSAIPLFFSYTLLITASYDFLFVHSSLLLVSSFSCLLVFSSAHNLFFSFPIYIIFIDVTEVSFSTDLNGGELTSNGDGLSMSEYVTIGVSSVLLGLIYVASVFLYIHLRRRKKDNETIVEERNDGNNKKNVVSGMEEGIVKSNPLLTLNHRHFNDATYSDSGSCSENERTTNVRKTTFEEDDRRKKIKNVSLSHISNTLTSSKSGTCRRS